MSILNKLTEGIVNRDLKKEGDALLSKWEKTGLLEGLESDTSKNGMARLLENQAKQLLKEASTMSGGDVEGFASVAFPLVRRVFGGLLANDLVSVQPMSLPSGLIFFLDFQAADTRNGVDALESVYGGGKVAKGIADGLTDITEDSGGFYNLANQYAHVTGTATIQMDNVVLASTLVTALTDAQRKLIRFDPDVLGTTTNRVAIVKSDDVLTTALDQVNEDALGAIVFSAGTFSSLGNGTPVRRLTYLDSDSKLNLVLVRDGGAITSPTSGQTVTCKFPISDDFGGSTVTGAVLPQDLWGLETASNTAGALKDAIPEIDIKVDSLAVTAMTKKLKAKWSPELGQDLNAYHNLDAEVELTSILSEQIALEIDREILQDLIQGATAGTYYWSRAPGLFVARDTGAELGATSAAPDFTGTVSEWYETLIETMNDVSAQIHRKTLRGGANFVVCGPEVANILEFTAGFRASVTADADRGTAGAVKAGSISKKWDIYVDPYFPRNVALVGRKGGSFLESGYVYAPYVPLQVTPTIFGTEDFVPRKGVMTRYAKKMVRPDMYGLVIVRGLLGEEGS
jgi:hypothetical protein